MIPLKDDNPTRITPVVSVAILVAGMALIPLFRWRHVPLFR